MAGSSQTEQRAPGQPPVEQKPFLRWHRRVLGFCLVVFALEIGLFLVAFPWRSEWEMNWVPLHVPALADLWGSSYFKGLVSGLGVLNIYIALVELWKQLGSLFGSGRK